MHVLSTREVLNRKLGRKADERYSLQRAGELLDRRTKGRWVLSDLSIVEREKPGVSIIVDAVRTKEQITAIRKSFGSIVEHIHLTAPFDALVERYRTRGDPVTDYRRAYAKIHRNPTESRVDKLRRIADVVIDTNRCTENDVLVRAASHLRLIGNRGRGFADILVGAQYGSEGKGQIADYLAKEYDLLVRVGGPNAGHSVFDNPNPYVFHLLPSGALKSTARLLLGPGMVINVPQLLEEIAKCGADNERLSIDPQVMVISDQDRANEKELVARISSTGQGVGAATARRIMDRGKVKLARDMPELRPYMRKAREVLSDAFLTDKKVFVEGTQGTGLSLYHGDYPHVTSRDTTVAGFLSEAGIPPSKVRRVIMVCRTYPIRVANSPKGSTSGKMSGEISWKEVSRRSGIPWNELKEHEKTSTTHRDRRVGEFDWELLQNSVFLNGPTDIALTFVDYLTIENRKARRFDQLDRDTINFIQEVERVACCPVSLIATRFDFRAIIDRRSW